MTGPTTLKVKLAGRPRKTLRRRGSLKVTAKIVARATDGSVATRSVSVKLRKRRH